MGKIVDKSQQYQYNPRSISDSDLNRLQEHLFKFGDLSGVVYCRKNKAYVGGNQRSKLFDGSQIEIIKEFDHPQNDKTVAIGFINWNERKYTYREVVFTEEEFREACIVANSDGGTWDTEVLKEHWALDQLQDWGFDIELLADDFLLEEEPITPKENPYTRKVESPIYEPSEVCPIISELIDTSKRDELVSEINSSAIPKEIKDFLLIATQRHIVFNYEKIADYYAHATDEVKHLMENSALVIPDFNRAIELGYVILSQEIQEQYKEEYGD